MRLQEEFSKLWTRVGCEPQLSDFVYGLFELAYAQPHRLYHTLPHIVHVWSELSWLHRQGIEVSDSTFMAAIGHDFIYDVTPQSKSEQRSALATALLCRAAGASEKFCHEVSAQICATAHVAGTTPAEPRLQAKIDQLLDADLSVLGATVGWFDDYERGVRFEYRHVPADIFCSVRAGILKGLLGDGTGPFYRTPQFEQKYGAVARANLAYSIARLERGVIIE